MKKITIIILVLLASVIAKSQEKGHEKHLREELELNKSLSAKQIDEAVAKEMKLIKSFNAKTASNSSDLALIKTPVLQDPCVNAGFDNINTFNFATFGWLGFGASGKGSAGYNATMVLSGLDPTTLAPGFPNATTCTPDVSFPGSAFGGSYIQPEPAGFDAIISSLQKSITGHSLRMGNRIQYRGAEVLSKTFIVPVGMNKFRFRYALVCVPDNASPGYFNAKVLDASGNIIDQMYDKGVSTNPFYVNFTTPFMSPPLPCPSFQTKDVYYRDWHIVELDVSAYIGQEVTVVLINSDCYGYGHFQHVYIDDFCTTQDDIQEGFIKINAIDSCQKFPFVLNGTFGLPNITGNPAQNVNITLKFYQAGVLVGSKVIPSPVAPNYSITISPADLPNVTGCIDVVAELSFKIKDMNNNLQTVIKASGNPNSGFRAGPNNDICFNCCSCAQTLSPLLVWVDRPQPPLGPIMKRESLTCGETYTDKLVCFKSYSLQTLNPCGENCTPDEYISTIKFTPAVGSGTSGYTLTGSTLVANLPGKYEVTIKVKCNGVWCKECKITFVQTKKCEPPCDNCKDKVQVRFDPAKSIAKPKMYPATTSINAAFLLGGGTDTYTEIRFNVVDVQITSDNPACLQCYNTPNQWGSITSGGLNGFTPTVTSYSGVSPLNGNNNPREIVFNAAAPTGVPNFTAMNVDLKISGYNPISCCCLKITLFVKVTFRNNKCEECSKIIPVVMTECAPKDKQTDPIINFGQNNGLPQFKQHDPSNGDNELLERQALDKILN